MNWKLFTLFYSFLTLIALGSSLACSPDSIGVETRDGKTLVLHKVVAGETLYSILKRYKCRLKDYESANPDGSEDIRTDEVLNIPISKKFTTKDEKRLADAAAYAPKAAPIKKPALAKKDAKPASKDTPPTAITVPAEMPKVETPKEPVKQLIKEAEPVVKKELQQKPEEKVEKKPLPSEEKKTPPQIQNHTVAVNQTLYSISKLYGVTVEDLKRWNNLKSNQISIDQILVVSDGKRGATQQATAPENKKTEAVVKNSEKQPFEKKKLSSGTADSSKKLATISPTLAQKQTKEVGLAGLIELEEECTSNFALHRSLPVGTIVQVRNVATNQSMTVKIIGKLPDTGPNDRLVIKLSPNVFVKLSPTERKFRAELSYSKVEPLASATKK